MNCAKRSGFTVIELLVSMVVLLILVSVLGRVLASATTAWNSGTKRVEINNSGRIAMEFMGRELSGLLLGQPGPVMALDSDATDVFGMASDVISFVSLNHEAEYRGSSKYRDVQQIRYAVCQIPGQNNRFALYRFVKEKWDPGFSAYENDSWISQFDTWENNPGLYGQLLVENVRNLEFFVTPEGQNDPVSDYTYNGSNPPAVIDVYLEVLGEQDAIKFAALPVTSETIAMANRATRRYASRVYMKNWSANAQ